MQTVEFEAKSFFLKKIQNFASEMQILFELECTIAGKDYPICWGIRNCINENIPLNTIISDLRSMAKQNYNAIADLLGISLADKIIAS